MLNKNTLKDMWDTYELNLKLNATISWVSLFMPYPGTSLGDYCIKRNLFNGNMDTIPEAFFDKTVLKYNKSTIRQLNNMQKLFSLFIKFRVPKIIANILIKFPLFSLYKFIGFRYKTKLYNALYKVEL